MLRERARDEDADAELADELFSMNTGGSGGGGGTKQVIVPSIDGYALKNLKDHLALAHDVAEAFEKKKSKANFQTKCVKEVIFLGLFLKLFFTCVYNQTLFRSHFVSTSDTISLIFLFTCIYSF